MLQAAATMNIQQQQRIDHLSSEVKRLRAAVSQFDGALEDRVTLIHDLEVALDAQAEAEELARIEEVKRDALALGLIESPVIVLNLGACPICLVAIPEPTSCVDFTHRRFPCCGTVCCKACNQNIEKKFDQARDLFNACYDARVDATESHSLEMRQIMTAAVQASACPFCFASVIEIVRYAAQPCRGGRGVGST
jgi:hypothetical protein